MPYLYIYWVHDKRIMSATLRVEDFTVNPRLFRSLPLVVKVTMIKRMMILLMITMILM